MENAILWGIIAIIALIIIIKIVKFIIEFRSNNFDHHVDYDDSKERHHYDSYHTSDSKKSGSWGKGSTSGGGAGSKW